VAPLTPDQYQRGSILESDGERYDVRGSVQAEGGGRFLVIGTLGKPQAGLVAEDVVRENEDDQYEVLAGDDADNARREAYEGPAEPDAPEPTPTTTPDTGGTEGTDPTGPPAAAPADATTTASPDNVPDPGGTPDSTAPAGPGSSEAGQSTTTQEG
jgi:type II secretory pathway pseudopilin PulG